MTSRTGIIRGNERHAQRVPIAIREAQTERHRPRFSLIVTVVLAVAGAVVAAMMLTVTPAFSLATDTGHTPGSSPSPTTSSDMPGMDHGAADMPGMEHGSEAAPGSSPSPTTSSDMPGMEHGAGTGHGSSPSPTTSSDMPGMDHGSGDAPGKSEHGKSEHGDTEGIAPDRPLAPVLGVFGGGTSAVLLTAGFLRRRDGARSQAKEASRAARRSQS